MLFHCSGLGTLSLSHCRTSQDSFIVYRKCAPCHNTSPCSTLILVLWDSSPLQAFSTQTGEFLRTSDGRISRLTFIGSLLATFAPRLILSSFPSALFGELLENIPTSIPFGFVPLSKARYFFCSSEFLKGKLLNIFLF